MKKIAIIGCLVLILSTGCGLENKAPQTEYKVNEEAFIDSYQIECNDFEKTDNILEVNYTLTNQSNQQVTVEPSNAFRLVQQDQMISANEDSSVTLEPSETKKLTVTFNVTETQDQYKVLFYSGVVDNNIAFRLKSN